MGPPLEEILARCEEETGLPAPDTAAGPGVIRAHEEVFGRSLAFGERPALSSST